MTLVRKAVAGLAALYTFEVLELFTDDEMRRFFADIFDSHPLAHTMAMYANACNGVDFLGIHQPSGSPEEQAYRDRYKAKNRYLFIELSLLTWKYRVNINPALEDKYKEKVFEGWRNLPTDDHAYMALIGNENSGTVPVPSSTDQTQNMVKSLFTGTLLFPLAYLPLAVAVPDTGLCTQ